MRRSYRDLEAWQRAMDLVVEIYAFTKRLPPEERFGLVSQLRRAAVSVPSNIAEGHGRLHKAEFLHHLSFANGSIREIDTQVEVTIRLGQVPAESCAGLTARITQVSQLLSGLIRAVRRYD